MFKKSQEQLLEVRFQGTKLEIIPLNPFAKALCPNIIKQEYGLI